MSGTRCATARPRAITNEQRTRVLRIAWGDGTESSLPHRWLRARCRCAACSQAGRVGGVQLDVDEDVSLTDIRPVAEQGLNLVFSDGHGRGIYPWAYLRALGEGLTAV